MKTRVQKWGNSLAVRIPRSFAAEMGWSESAPVEISLDDGAMIIKSDKERTWDLQSLLSGVTDENIHSAWEDEDSVAADAGSATDKNDAGDG
ncbi:MAG: AbrB/MazE/SpoVT family DNA-binding domain-containing protein [Candidatus Aminicenantes bacterium]|nr:AbrB/MazE/SpoVT family DNA-binding domain-containing protein [Candidatus Aminicenantes bacterium]